jgi:hypothetical protein
MPLSDPVHPEPVPTAGGDPPPTPGDRIRSAPLSRAAVAFLQQSLARHQRRRQVYRAGHLRVYLDGAERWQVNPRVGVCKPFRAPLSASYLEIFGDDAEGALLLAVFPLPEPEELEDDGVQHLSVTLEGEQTVALAMTLGDGTSGEERAYVMQITYAESTTVDTQGPDRINQCGSGTAH